MKIETTELEVQDLITQVQPTLNRILVKLITESDNYAGTEIKRLDTSKAVEPYVFVQAVGEQVKSTKAGDYALTRLGMSFDAFPLCGSSYSLINEHDIIAVISKEVTEQMNSDRITQQGRKELMIN